MIGRSFWSNLLDAISDGITLGAEMLCPVDHTAVRRAQAAADALADREAEVDHLEAELQQLGEQIDELLSQISDAFK